MKPPKNGRSLLLVKRILNLWPTDLVATTNFTLPAIPTDYEDLDEGTDECPEENRGQ